MDKIITSGKITLHKEGLFATDIAADGGWLYLLDRRWQKVHRFTMSGESSGEYGTARKYSRFCYDKGEQCFWAVAGAAQTIYRLSPDFKEIGSFCSGIPETSPAESLKYLADQGKLLAAFRGSAYEIYKIGFSRPLLHSAQPLRLYDQIGDNHILVFETGERDVVVTDRSFSNPQKITLPEGSHYIGETSIYDTNPCLAVLFCKNSCSNAVTFIKDEKKENGTPAMEDILSLFMRQPSLLSLLTPPQKHTSTHKEQLPETPQEKADGINPWGFIGDLLNL